MNWITEFHILLALVPFRNILAPWAADLLEKFHSCRPSCSYRHPLGQHEFATAVRLFTWRERPQDMAQLVA